MSTPPRRPSRSSSDRRAQNFSTAPMARLLKLAAVWLAIVFIAHHSLEEQYVERVMATRAEDQARMDELEKTAASAQATRRMDAHLAVVNGRKAQEQELEKAWGGGLSAIPKDYRLNLAEMLATIARGVVPEGSKVEVSVERFTDFALHVELPTAVPVAELATISGKVLEMGAPYLHRLSFFAERRLIGEVDPLSIETVARKTLPPRDVITRALVMSTRDEPKLPPVAAGPGAPKERNSEAIAPYERIMQEWSDAYGKRMEAVSKVVSRLSDAVDLRTLKTRGDVTLRLKSVDAASEEIAKAEKYFPTCLGALKAQLTPQIDPLVASITMRETESARGGEIRQIGSLLTEIAAFQLNVRRLLQTLDAPGAVWNISERGTIVFGKQETLTAFNLRSAEVEANIAKVNAAAQALSAAAGKK